MAGNRIWVSLDETTDAIGRFVVNVVIGILSKNNPGKIFLLTSEVIDTVNHSTIAAVFDMPMNLLWPKGIIKYNIVLFISGDAT